MARKFNKFVAGLAIAGLLVSQTAQAAYIGPVPIGVTAGGTGAATFTTHGVMLGEGTSALGVTAVGSTGIPLIGQTGADPIYGTASVGGGGTGATTFTVHGVLVGETTSAIVATAAGTSGVPLIGQGAADPIFGTAVVGGGGTGGTTFTAHGILVGEGTSAFAALSPAADSFPLWQSSGADPTVTAINNCTGGSNALTYATASHTFGCNAISTAVPTTSIVTGASPITLAGTNMLTTIVSMATPAAATINLPASPSANQRSCVKDGTTNFASNNATVKTTDSTTIDGVTGATGIVMNQAHQENCFIFSTNWYIE